MVINLYFIDNIILNAFIRTVFIAAILVAGLSIIDSKVHAYTSEVETEPLDLQLNLNPSQTFKESSTKPYASVYSTVDNTKQGFVILGSLQPLLNIPWWWWLGGGGG